MFGSKIKKIISVTLITVFMMLQLAGCSEDEVKKIPAAYGSYGADFARELAASYPYRKAYSGQETAAGEMIKLELSSLGYEVEEIKKSNDMQTIRQIRAHVLDFANSCMNHRKHSKQDFENIIDENTLYETLVKKYRIKNKVYEEDYKFIMKIYHHCQDNNCFLRDPDVDQEETA